MKIFISILLGISLLSCSKIESDVPSCIKKQIREYRTSSAICPNASVEEYQYQEKKYYVFSPGNCGADMGGSFYNESCERVGYVFGLTGEYFIEDPDFEKAEFVRIVWENN